MRDVSPGSTSTIHVIGNYLKRFARNPLVEIRHLPDWNWSRVLTMQLALAIISGILSSVITTQFSTWKLAQGILFFPLVATVIGLLLASFFYYYFQVFERRTVSYIKLATLVFLSNTVFYVFYAVGGLIPFVDILGLGFASILMIIGLTENFQVPKKRSLRLVGILFLLVLAIWLFEKIRNNSLARSVSSGNIEKTF